MKTLLLIVMVAGAMNAATAAAQSKEVRISPEATYENALVCYQHYATGMELARKLEKSPQATADEAAGFQLQALALRKVLARWSDYLGAKAGDRPKTEIDADLKKLGDPVVADANAALGGDKAAAQRGVARSMMCTGLEVAGQDG
jgi:Skp family chaperone for outer membrane proteins